VRLVNPAAGVRSATPLLQLDRGDVFAFLVVEVFLERLGILLAHLRRGTADENEGIAAIIEDRDGSPTLCLGFCLDEHRSDPPWPRVVMNRRRDDSELSEAKLAK